MIIYWSKINSIIKIYTIQATIRFIFPGRICDDISYSMFLEGYISNNHEVSLYWLLKWRYFSVIDNTLYLMACKIGLPCKSLWISDLEIALWASKSVQIITGSTLKTVQLKNQHKPSCKSEFSFFFLLINVTLLA